jgi:hypothetical protein
MTKSGAPGVNARIEAGATVNAPAAGGLFGSAVAAIGDINHDGILDIAVGAPGDDRVFVLFLGETLGSVLSFATIDSSQGNLAPYPTTSSEFGAALLGIGDVDGDCRHSGALHHGL